MPTTGIITTTAIALAALGVLLFFLLTLRHARRIARLNEEISRISRDRRFERRVAASNRGDAVSRLGMTVNTLFEVLSEQQERLTERQGLLHALADTVPAMVAVHREQVLYANPAAVEWFGAGVLNERPVIDLVRPALRRRVLDGVRELLAGTADPARFDVTLMDDRGRPLDATVQTARIAFEGAPAILSVATPAGTGAMDRHAGARRAQATLESIGEAVLTTDFDGRIDYMNAAAQQLTGSNLAVARGKTLDEIISLVDETDRKSLGDPVSACLRDRRRVNLGRRALLLARSGSGEYSVELTASPQRDDKGETIGAVVVLHDVSELRGLARQMSYQATHDALTGLVNRREFERRLDEALQSAHAGDAGHVLCYLDLDRFKVVNDTSGHMAGDSMLREVATLIRDRVRDSDTVGRLGGDEFGMLLIGCPLDKARQIADDVCSAIRDYRFVWRDKIFNIGVSLGLVEIGRQSGSIEELLSAADSACYVAKQQGRGRVHVYSARDEAAARQRGDIQWLQRLQTALKEDRFELFTQPILSLAGHTQTGPAFEILLRLRDESGRLVLPAEFLGAAERYHLTNHVDRWVVQAALAAIGRGRLKLPDNRSAAINLSGQTLGDESFLDFVVECLDRSDVRPAQICFELSEASVAMNLSHAKRLVDVLHSMGCAFALDDFGSGLGSFANLKNLGPDYVKLDGSLIHDLQQNSVNEAMVTAMVKLARTLGFQVIAEQVEDQQTFAAVRGLGVDFVQGYVVGRPQPLA
jgi:diguanylate cyclase (GGDEF)-like protein/PAS domain S-box-containing protein